MIPPVLTTDRLVLCAPASRDLDPFAVFFALSPRNRHNRVPAPDAWRLFAAVLWHGPIRGWGLWTLTQRGHDPPIGLAGCLQFPEWREPGIGRFLWDGHEGQGCATEAARAARACAYGRFGWTTAVSHIDADNAPPIRVAERLGARVEPGAPHRDEGPALVCRHPAPSELA